MIERDLEVLGPVLLKSIGMVLLAIDFKAYAFGHHHIDALEVAHRHLGDNMVPAEHESSSREALWETSARFIHKFSDEAQVERHLKHQRFEIDSIEGAGRKCPIESRDRSLDRLIQDHVKQSIR